jgi:hypothetical protein
VPSSNLQTALTLLHIVTFIPTSANTAIIMTVPAASEFQAPHELTALTLSPGTFHLQPRVILGWPDICSGAGARALQGLAVSPSSVPKESVEEGSISWIGFSKDGLQELKNKAQGSDNVQWTEEEEQVLNGITVYNLKDKNVSIMPDYGI